MLFGTFGGDLLGLLVGKLMLDTRGIAWPWAIHVALDVVVYPFIAAGRR